MKKLFMALLVSAIVGSASLSVADDDMDMKPKGTDITIKGILVDTNCFLKEGAKGNDHDDMKACGSDCLKDGVPAGVLVDDKLYILIFPAPVFAPYVGKTVEVSGTLVNGNQVLPRKASVVDNNQKKDIKLKGKVMM